MTDQTQPEIPGDAQGFRCHWGVPESVDPDKDSYALDVDSTLMRLRFPIIIRQARETFGDDVCPAGLLIFEKK